MKDRTEKEGMDNGCRKGEGVEWKRKVGEERRREGREEGR